MTAKEKKRAAIEALVFALLSLILIFHRSATKHIMITDVAGINVDRESSESSYELLVDRNVPGGKEGTLIIPLSKSVSSDNITLEDGYVDHKLRIFIDSREAGFYMDNAVATDLKLVTDALCINLNDTGSVCLEFTLDGFYANESALTDNSTIEVRFFDPSERYDRIVVVDAAGSAGTEGVPAETQHDDITLETALLLKEIADKDTVNNIKIYFTGLSGKDIGLERKRALVTDSKADLFLEISEGASENGIGAYYNDGFFLRRLTNAGFADMMLKSCAQKAEISAVGVFDDSEDELLAGCRIPAARLDLGSAAGYEDAAGHADRNVLKKLAEGIYDGIINSFEEMQ